MGYIRKRLARMLSVALTKEHGEKVTVEPDMLHEARGWYRTSTQSDSYRWSGRGRIGDSLNCIVSLDSYSTMTAIVKSGGVVLMKDPHRATVYDVYDATGN